jgi:predicted nucleic acid-binding protein
MSSVFIDSNICVYAFDRLDSLKRKIALALISQTPCISSQVIIETYNASRKKLKLPLEICAENTLFLCDITQVIEVSAGVIKTAILLTKKYNFSFLDACIVAAALSRNCSILYSEDMQHNLLVELRLTIKNPFLDQF